MSPARVVHAAFDLALDPRDRTGPRLHGAFLAPPQRVLRAEGLDEVPAVVAAAEAAAAAGDWVVGGLAYEAGGAWDCAQRTRPGAGELAHFEVFAGEPESWPEAAAPPALDWFPSGGFGRLTPAGAIAAVQAAITAGDCYQVNLTTRVAAEAAGVADGDLYPRFRALARAQPGGYAVLLRGAGVASVSPELFFQSHPDGRLVTQPMKGTAGAASPPEQLRENPKERAENLMIVDLLRNDLGRVCVPGSVRVDALFDLLALPTLWQLVSTVSGRARPGTTLADVFGALFPCGSVTGAPKIRAMEVIAGLEQDTRGWYCGALGVIRPGGAAVFNVPIRTVQAAGERLVCGVGSGIVADSDPAAELAEWWAKTRFLGGGPFAALESLRLVAGEYPRLAGHLERLASTDAALGLGVDLAAAADLLQRVRSEHPGGDRRVRLVAGGDALAVSVADLPVTPVPLPLAIAAEPLDVAGYRPVVVHKTTWRAHYDRLRRLAPRGAFDVICHTPQGVVTEATAGNLAFRLDGRWVTPPAGAVLLPGVERAAALADGTLVEADVRLADLARADGFAYLNAVRGWCPAILL